MNLPSMLIEFAPFYAAFCAMMLTLAARTGPDEAVTGARLASVLIAGLLGAMATKALASWFGL